MIAALGTVVFLLFYTARLDAGADRDSRTIQDFYHKTLNAMDGGKNQDGPGQAVLDTHTGQKAGHIPADKDADGDVDEDDERVAAKMQERLKAAEQEAKDKANEKALRPDPPSKVNGVGSSADGQTKKGGKAGDAAAAVEKEDVGETKEAREAAIELDSILKKAPGASTPAPAYNLPFANYPS